jgi:hypothetical protein
MSESEDKSNKKYHNRSTLKIVSNIIIISHLMYHSDLITIRAYSLAIVLSNNC